MHVLHLMSVSLLVRQLLHIEKGRSVPQPNTGMPWTGELILTFLGEAGVCGRVAILSGALPPLPVSFYVSWAPEGVSGRRTISWKPVSRRAELSFDCRNSGEGPTGRNKLSCRQMANSASPVRFKARGQ